MTETLTLNRKFFTDRSSVGNLYLLGNLFCNTIELSCRRGDEKGKLAIPAGNYEIRFDKSKRYGCNMPFLFNHEVGRSGTRRPDGSAWLRTDIMIHPANQAEELDGCIAPGVYDDSYPDWVSSSRVTFGKLIEKLTQIKGPLTLVITGGYPFTNTPHPLPPL